MLCTHFPLWTFHENKWLGRYMLLHAIFSNDLLPFYLSVQPINNKRTYWDFHEVEGWILKWIAKLPLSFEIMKLLYTYMTILECKAPEMFFFSQNENTAFTAGGRCVHPWSKQQCDIFRIANGSKLLYFYHWGKWKSLNVRKKNLLVSSREF